MKDLIKSIAHILSATSNVITKIRNFLLNGLFIIVLIFLIVLLIPEKKATIPDNTILRLDIVGDIVEERRMSDNLEKYLGTTLSYSQVSSETVLQDILDIIATSKDDDQITAILLNLKRMGKSGLNQLSVIGQALEDFKKSGKKVYASEDFYNQPQYFLATFADRIFINPMGHVSLKGFGMYRLYFKDVIDRLEINYNTFKVGSHKSALEVFNRNSMSQHDRQQNQQLLSTLWQFYANHIVKKRSLKEKLLRYYTDELPKALEEVQGDTAQLALKTGLVDQVATRTQITKHLVHISKAKNGTPSIISSNNYFKNVTPSYTNTSSTNNKIGIIVAEGTILPGKQPAGVIGGDSLSALIKRVKRDKSFKGLVLRINTGGGSAFASEIIRQQILELKQRGKTVVVSMGRLAASGGYWIAANADEIWASPTTITGSIGIFGAIPTFEKSLANLGIYRDGIGTTPLASGIDLTQPLADPVKNAIQQSIENNYLKFLNIVSEGRKKSIQEVEQLAQGKIYDGKRAKELGLVDKLGTIEEAIESAASLAKLDDYEIELVEKHVSVKDKFLDFLLHIEAKFDSLFFMRNVPESIKLFSQLRNDFDNIISLQDPKGTYAHCMIQLSTE